MSVLAPIDFISQELQVGDIVALPHPIRASKPLTVAEVKGFTDKGLAMLELTTGYGGIAQGHFGGYRFNKEPGSVLRLPR